MTVLESLQNIKAALACLDDEAIAFLEGPTEAPHQGTQVPTKAGRRSARRVFHVSRRLYSRWLDSPAWVFAFFEEAETAHTGRERGECKQEDKVPLGRNGCPPPPGCLPTPLWARRLEEEGLKAEGARRTPARPPRGR